MPVYKKTIKPIVKWAGGKTQMLKDILARMPKYSGKYIEPFFGGGALFFELQPENAIISDSNPELINVYEQVAYNVENVIKKLKSYENTEEMFYDVRSLDWQQMTPEDAAARTIYLNKTCFNGLYRVNRKGQFNTPYGKYKNPKICDEELLNNVSVVLQKAKIICGDYLDVLQKYARPGDFIYLDPPYIPVSANSDFKRYTKEQFYEEDHQKLANEVNRLYNLGCYVIETNSNHPLVFELYDSFEIEVLDTKRSISSKGNSRKSKDTIISIFPVNKKLDLTKTQLSEQVDLYPPTRFMGSKSKILDSIWALSSEFEFNTVLDLFSGSGIVGYMFKAQGKKVICNDYMAMSATFTKALIENNNITLPMAEAKALLVKNKPTDRFVETKFKDLYYSDRDNQLIDILRTNIWDISNEYKRAIALTALIRACIKKRPRGIFTYTGNRYNDGRRDLLISLEQQFLEAISVVNKAIFDNHQNNKSLFSDSMELKIDNVDLVYIDPPYYSPLSDNEYVRRYHFVEGIARDWKGVEFQEHTKTKKFKSYPTPFSSQKGAEQAFDNLFSKYRDSIIILSYSTNSLPTRGEIIELLKKYKNNVEVVPIDYTYSFGNQKKAKTHRNNVQELLFVGY